MTILDKLYKKLDDSRDYKEVFGTTVGQRVLNDIMRSAGVLSPTFTTDTNELLVLEGQRRLAYSIYRRVHASMNPLLKSIEEEQQRQINQG
jgi:hypothetical protein